MFYPDSGLLIVSTETDNEYVEPLIQEVYHEIDRLHQEVVPVEELSMVRNYMLGEMCRSYESAFSLSDAWIFIATSGLGDDYFSRSLQSCTGGYACRITRFGAALFVQREIKKRS